MSSNADLSTLEDSFDIGIQYGHGNWADLDETFLGGGEVVPVCSPQFLMGRPIFKRPADLLDQPLLQLDDDRMDWVSWPSWFREMGIEEPYPPPSLRVNDYTVLAKLAFEGHGIALGMKLLMDTHFERDWFVVACDFPMRTGLSFYLVVPRGKLLTPESGIVRDWIVNQFRG